MAIVVFYLIAVFGFKSGFPSQHLKFFLRSESEPVKVGTEAAMTTQREVVLPAQKDVLRHKKPVEVEEARAVEAEIVTMEGVYKGIVWGDYAYAVILDDNGEEHQLMLFEDFKGRKVINMEYSETDVGRRCRFSFKKEKQFIPEANENVEITRLVSFAWQ